MGRWVDGWRRRTREIRRRVAGVSTSSAWFDPVHSRFMELGAGSVPGPQAADGLLTDEELHAELFKAPETRLLARYPASVVEASLERFGLLEIIRRRGWRDLRVESSLADPSHQLVRISGEHRQSHVRGILVELVLRRYRIGELDLVAIDWMQLQNPEAHFCRDRPRLPDQQYPGLGCADAFIEWLIQLTLALHLDGLASRPSHYHIALCARGWHFLSPATEGRFVAMRDLLRGRSIAEATRLVEQGRVQLGDGTPVTWMPDEMALPVSSRLGRWFDDPDYLERAAAAEHACLSHGMHVVRRRPIPTIVH